MCTATPRRQHPLASQGARTPMNGEPRTDLIQLINERNRSRVNDDLAPARPTDRSTLRDYTGAIVEN
jgi:hypothetical protein